MELYIGGYAQGKLTYVLKKTGIPPERVYDAAAAATDCAETKAAVINHFHILVKTLLEEGKDPEDRIREILARNPRVIVISDEVGNGIVPADAGEREYRERLGRILCGLAEKADKVERIVCGIGQKIK
ncbi:bifunctional adenosylcobinamide kinase/adenosylcobinamide-phosphate guanylyltransferase [Caproiciproducens sp. CPB-2]|uniref:bifunctional adenosylcobinamide kinase/adenosylcobinamide-phosphate guanylyltransferase n=1 Tax=Caproiciproducens sp. CPB-2 TaxID=3030017 RepID=UPI0023DACF38|nr:bifunctional adenosylcobinamide kinase/adenosylcobinamide-phosphate guanylyltransferase [Caproiciproducens sp. CPB-2]MDF1495627.1 bifunctional adenosylcobinamide kinase/adenosylcobinamide-phosphate guanylyltransferase [Caproiciproducens sp. CPB-2]